ncbi:MAG: flagellar assembly protein FliH [Hyphomicrobiales bacterium]|nr:flagellar assembly protein FliH [Hyphomicrobiales bacterium]
MGAPAKFLFDNDFGAPTPSKPAVVPLAEHAAQLTQAEATGYRKGFEAARSEGEQRSAAALERMVVGLDSLNRSLAALAAQLETEAVGVAVAVGKKLAGALIEREPLSEVSSLVSDCIRQLVSAPHVVIRINSELYNSAREKLEEVTRAGGFEGRLVVLAEPEIAPGDCRVEWADGGVARDSAAINAAIEGAVARYLAGRGGT